MPVTERDIELAIQDVKERNHLTQAALEALLKREGLSMEDYRKKISEEILIRKATNMEVRSRIEVTTGEVEAYYQARLSDFMPLEQLRASHILVAAPRDGEEARDLEARARAETLLKRARSGEDFSELARRYSEDGSGARGGDLGLIRRGEILPDVERVLFSLQPGEVGPLVRTPAGYHIVKLNEKVPRKARPLKEVEEEIRDRIYAEKAEARYQRWLEELKKKAYIEVSM
jgi:peptidyl-prolyl cis-trans isomerase SurA